MANFRAPYVASVVPPFRCTSHRMVYEGPEDTDVLVANATNIMKTCEQSLRAAHNRYQLDKLLWGMLTDAPHPNGKRYVAVAVQIAYATKGQVSVVALAKAWTDELFLPILNIHKSIPLEPFGDDTPRLINTTIQLPRPVAPTSDFGIQVAEREQRRCAVIKRFDYCYYMSLLERKIIKKFPIGDSGLLYTVHIIPFMINTLVDNGQQEPGFQQFFLAWTQIELRGLIGEKINTPANGVLLCSGECHLFKGFEIYFDEEAHPGSRNKYRVQRTNPELRLANAEFFADVQFPTLAESGVEPPNPMFLKVHASFAKVLYQSGVGEYYRSLARDTEPVFLDTEGGTALLTSKLALLTH